MLPPFTEDVGLDRLSDTLEEEADRTLLPAPHQYQETTKSVKNKRDWGQHPLNLRVSLPLPFGRWYLTLVAGREKRSQERLIEEREKHPLETASNLMFLLSIGIISTAFMLLITALVLIHGFGWSIYLKIPA